MNFNQLWNKIVQKANTKKDFSNKNIAKALNEVDNPQLDYKTIHIGGTNGKGSTANFIYSFLKTKFKTGIFLSPSVIYEMEMAQVNGKRISKETFLLIYQKYQKIIENNNLSFFEIKVFISFIWFKSQKVDYAIIEVGLGGLYDGTNVLNSEVCVVTNIGDDHREYLGHSFKEKAFNKLGIQQSNIKLFTSEQKLINQSKYPEHIILNKLEFSFNNFPSYQKSNYNLAIQVLEFLNFDKKEIIKEIKKAKLLPFRFQKIKNNVFFDGAHNVHGIKALVSSLDKAKDYVFIFSALHYKNYVAMINVIKKHGKVYLTNFKLHENKSSFNAKIVAHKLQTNYLENISDLKRKNNKIYIYCGSFYFLKSIENLI